MAFMVAFRLFPHGGTRRTPTQAWVHLRPGRVAANLHHRCSAILRATIHQYSGSYGIPIYHLSVALRSRRNRLATGLIPTRARHRLRVQARRILRKRSRHSP